MGEAPGQTPAISQVPPGSSHFSGALHETLCLPPGKPAVSQLPASLLEALLLGPVCCPEGLSPFRAQANPAPGGSGPVLRQPPGWPQPLLPLQYGKRENSRLDFGEVELASSSERRKMGGGAPDRPVPSLGPWASCFTLWD